jgi:hypothetical protein
MRMRTLPRKIDHVPRLVGQNQATLLFCHSIVVHKLVESAVRNRIALKGRTSIITVPSRMSPLLKCGAGDEGQSRDGGHKA